MYHLLSPPDKTGRIAWCCLELSVLYYMNSQIGEVFGAIHPASRNGATVALTGKLLFGEAVALEDHTLLRDAFSLCELLLQAEYPVSQMGDTLLMADDRLIQWMEDEKSMLCHPFVQEGILEDSVHSPVWEEKRKELLQEIIEGGWVLSGEMVVAALSGTSGSGRKYLVKQISKELGRPLLIVDISYFGSLESLLVQWRKLLGEVLLQPVLICISGVKRQSSWESEIYLLR